MDGEPKDAQGAATDPSPETFFENASTSSAEFEDETDATSADPSPDDTTSKSDPDADTEGTDTDTEGTDADSEPTAAGEDPQEAANDASTDAVAEDAAPAASDPVPEPEPEPEPEHAAAPEPETAPAPEPETSSTAQPAARAEPVAAPAPAPVIVKRVGFFRVVLGGVIAAGLGAGALFYADRENLIELGTDVSAFEAQLQIQADEIAALKAALAAAAEENEAAQTSLTALEVTSEATQAAAAANADALGDANAAIAVLEASVVDLAPVNDALAALQSADAGTEATVDGLNLLVSELRTRLGDLEVQPIPRAELPNELVVAYDRQVADILDTVNARFDGFLTEQSGAVGGLKVDLDAKVAALQEALETRIATLETGTESKVDALEAEVTASVSALDAEITAKMAEIESEIQTRIAAIDAAETMASEAEAAARTAALETAIARIGAALDRGEEFAEPLADFAALSGAAPDPALGAVAEDGAATMASLAEAFPAAARAALSATADLATDGERSFSSIIMTQLGARSLEPREGDDPDAVLSRAEAAAKAGDLAAALNELDGLPQEGREAFAGWIADATALRDARAAATQLSAQINPQ